MKGRFNLRETSKVSVLVGLKVTSQVEAQAEILPRSALMQPAAVTGSSTIIKRLVSSANKRIFDPISFTISLIYSRKRRGPNKKEGDLMFGALRVK